MGAAATPSVSLSRPGGGACIDVLAFTRNIKVGPLEKFSNELMPPSPGFAFRSRGPRPTAAIFRLLFNNVSKWDYKWYFNYFPASILNSRDGCDSRSCWRRRMRRASPSPPNNVLPVPVETKILESI